MKNTNKEMKPSEAFEEYCMDECDGGDGCIDGRAICVIPWMDKHTIMKPKRKKK